MKWVVYLFFAICVVFHWFAAGCKSNCPPGMIAHVHHWSLGPNFWTTEATLLGNCFWWSSTDLCLDTTVLLSSGAIFGCRWPFTCICWCLLPLPFRKAHGMLGCNFIAFQIRILYLCMSKKEQICFLATALIEVRKSYSPVCVKSVGRCHHPALEETWKQIGSLSGPCEFLWKGWRRSVNIIFISLTLHLRSPKTQPEAEQSQITLHQRYMETTLKHSWTWAKNENDHVIPSHFLALSGSKELQQNALQSAECSLTARDVLAPSLSCSSLNWTENCGAWCGCGFLRRATLQKEYEPDSNNLSCFIKSVRKWFFTNICKQHSLKLNVCRWKRNNNNGAHLSRILNNTMVRALLL